MIPRAAQNDRRDGGLPDAVAFGELHLRRSACVRTTDREHLAGGQLGVAVVAPDECRAATATLSIHVGDVVELRSEEQVPHVAAQRVIATVQHLQSVGDVATLKFPREAVGERVAAAATAARDLSVAGTVDARDPLVAGIWPVVAINLGRESSSERSDPRICHPVTVSHGGD